MGNTDSSPTTAAAPHAHSSHHGGHGHLSHATNGGAMNGHVSVVQTVKRPGPAESNSNSNGSSSAVYAGTVHQMVGRPSALTMWTLDLHSRPCPRRIWREDFWRLW